MVASLNMSARFVVGRQYNSLAGQRYTFSGVDASGLLSFVDWGSICGEAKSLTQAEAATMFGTQPSEVSAFVMGCVYQSHQTRKVYAYEGTVGGLLSFRDGHRNTVRLTTDEASEAFGGQDGLDPLWEIAGVSRAVA